MSAKLNLRQWSAQKSSMDSLLMVPRCTEASLLVVVFFLLHLLRLCGGGIAACEDYIKEFQQGESMQVQTQESFLVPSLCSLKLSCVFTRVIVTRSDRGLDSFGRGEACLCLFALNIFKGLFVSLLEGPWGKKGR